jgi:tetratricopeptide (TPR) repeat protein
MNYQPLVVGTLAFLSVVLTTPRHAFSADAVPSPSATNQTEQASSQETMRAFLQLQEQLHATQLAIELNRQEAKQAAVQNAEALAGRLQAVEQALAAQRSKEWETMQDSNRIMLVVAGAFATIGLVALVLMAWFQWKTINGLAALSAAFPAGPALGSGQAAKALGMGEADFAAAGPAQPSSVRLLGALEQLEKRLYELEHTSVAQAPAKQVSVASEPVSSNPATPEGNGGRTSNGIGLEATANTPEPIGLFEQGQLLLDKDDAQGALACFEQLLAEEPNNAEALVKKGAALERMQKLEAAIECYDRAIAADSSLTIAYLHKGGLFNRMERFDDALACYEQALRTQQKRGA